MAKNDGGISSKKLKNMRIDNQNLSINHMMKPCFYCGNSTSNIAELPIHLDCAVKVSSLLYENKK